MMSLFSEHRTKWESCTLCPLCETRTKVVLARGTIPAPVLFIGEAPGASEDVLGRPFCGPAGKLLDRIINEGFRDRFKFAMTNIIACIPKTEGKKAPDVPAESISACHPRLVEFVTICRPRLIVLVGDVAKKEIIGQADFGDCEWLGDGFMLFAQIRHPAFLLRLDPALQGIEYQRAVVALEHAALDYEQFYGR